MKALLVIQKKLTAALILLLVFVVLLLTNFTEKRHTAQMNQAAASIYKDRLMVESYIYFYSKHLREIDEIARNPLTDTSRTRIQSETASIEKLNALYRQTVLTDKERSLFKEFNAICNSITIHSEKGNQELVSKNTRSATQLLDALSAIQIEQAGLEIQNMDKLSSDASLYSQLEIAMLIVVALLVQVLVFTSKSIARVLPGIKMSLN